MADSIRYDGNEVGDLLEKAGALFLAGTAAYRQLLVEAGRAVGAKGEELAGGYPDEPRRPLNPYYTRVNAAGDTYQSKFKTQKQQGYFFANLGDGGITLPYQRTGWLGATLASEVDVTEAGVLVEIGSPLGYAPLVIGNRDEQSFYHAETGWEPLAEQLDEASEVLVNVFVEKMVEGVEAYLTR